MHRLHTEIDRRTALRWAGLTVASAGLGSLLTACGGDDSASTGDSTGGSGESKLIQTIKDRGHAILGIVDSPNGSMVRDGEPVGYNVDIVKSILRKHGIEEFEAFQADFTGMVSGLIAKKFDICCAGLLITEERCQSVALTTPVNALIYALAVPTGNPDGLASIEDFGTKGLTLAVESATTQERVAREIIDEDLILTVSSRQDGADAIRIDRAAGYLAPMTALEPLLEDVDDLEITDIVPDMPKIGSTIAMRLEDQDFVETFNADFAEMRESGEYEEIMTEYGADPSLIDLPDLLASC